MARVSSFPLIRPRQRLPAQRRLRLTAASERCFHLIRPRLRRRRQCRPTATPANFQTLFSFACASSTGKEPHGRLTLDPNLTTLYGMTRKGGEHDLGVVFSIRHERQQLL